MEESLEASKNWADGSKNSGHGNAKVTQDQNKLQSSLNSYVDSSSNEKETIEATKNWAGGSKKRARGNAKVTRDHNRHKSGLNSEDDLCGNPEESLEAAKNCAGGRKNSACGNAKVTQEQPNGAPSDAMPLTLVTSRPSSFSLLQNT